jgi:signal transduction histidine kinase
VKPRLSLRARILIFTVLPIVTLTFATLWIVNHRITTQVEQGMRDDLRRASAVVGNVLDARAHTLALAGDVIVRDPRFFSVLTIPGSWRDEQLRSTVAGVARDFNVLTQADLFEVMDTHGHLLASVGRRTSDEAGRDALVQDALEDRPVSGILVSGTSHFQALVVPVQAGGRVIGALLLGSQIDAPLADELRALTRSEVTFLSRGVGTASTLEREDDREAVLRTVANLARVPNALPSHGALLEVQVRDHTYLTLVGAIPQATPGQDQIYVMQRSLDVEMGFLREIQFGLIELGGIALIVALLAGMLIAQRITSPVQQLVRGAEEMERGNYDYPLEVRSADEIGYLASRFRDMRQKQRAVVSSLEEVARIRSEFISVASHELRTPISIIRGFEELMAQGNLGAITDDQREALAAIRRSVGTLTRIAEDATRMSHIEDSAMTLAPTPCEIARVVQDAAEAAKNDAPSRRVQLVLELEPNLGEASVDRPRLAIAIANLIRNGIRFTPDGGRVTVRARRGDVELEIAVQDTGVGIEPERQQHLFEHAFMVRDSANHHSSSSLEFNSAGLGMGLSIASGIVNAHGGTILVESLPGHGSTFTILLPLAAAAPRLAA